MGSAPVPAQFTVVDHQDEKAFNKFLDAMAAAFEKVAITISFLTETDQTPPPYPSPLVGRARIREHVSRIKQLAEDGAILVEAGDMSAVAVWEPSDFKGKPFSENQAEPGPLRKDFRDQIRRLKEKNLAYPQQRSSEEIQLQPFYHLAFLGRNPDRPSVPGAISAVVTPFLEKAKHEGVAVWLEATSERAVMIYKHFGFRDVGAVTTGVGSRNADGWPEDGGEGVTCHALIYDNHLRN